MSSFPMSSAMFYDMITSYALWCLYFEICSILCRPSLRVSYLCQADDLIIQFYKKFEIFYGEEKCTPNMHMHGHLCESIIDIGPVYSFWCFSFECYNRILEGMQKTWHAPKVQLFHKIFMCPFPWS